MPRPLISPVSPLKRRETTLSAYALTPGMSIPSRLARIPNCDEPRARSAISAAWRSAFVRAHPTWRHVPPSLSFSTRPTERPSWAARRAQAYPPDPAPRTSTSKSPSLTFPSLHSLLEPSQGAPLPPTWHTVLLEPVWSRTTPGPLEAPRGRHRTHRIDDRPRLVRRRRGAPRRVHRQPGRRRGIRRAANRRQRRHPAARGVGRGVHTASRAVGGLGVQV